MEKELTIAIPKGYLFGECTDLLKKAGYDIAPLESKDRKLVVYSKVDSIKYIISRPMDVPVYVEHGACDIGFAGKDVLAEKESKVYELLDLKNGNFRSIFRYGVSRFIKNLICIFKYIFSTLFCFS